VVSSVNISTTKAIAVQVNDRAEFVFNGDSAASCGNIHNMGTRGSTVKVVSGNVSYIDNDGEGWLEVVGGTIGSASRNSYAIKNDEWATAIISGNAKVVSGDTGYVYGTIQNKGKLTISGGHVYNNDSLAQRVVVNRGKLTVSDSAKITSDSYSTRTVAVIDDGRNSVTNEVTLDITGGTISAIGKGHAVYMRYSVARISGNSEISNKDPNASAVYIQYTASVAMYDGTVTSLSNNPNTPVIYVGPRTFLYLYGGTVTSMAANSNNMAVAVRVFEGGRDGYGRIELGGSPIVNGLITWLEVNDYPIMVCTNKEYELKSTDKPYRVLVNNNITDDIVVVKNGAGVSQNFELKTTNAMGLKFAVNGDDLIATASTFIVTFSTNGAMGNPEPPKPIKVKRGGTIGEVGMPSTYGYISKDGYYNDSVWYIRTGISTIDGSDQFNVPFRFGVGDNGTPVEKDEILTLRWTNNRAISAVLESSRDLPASRNTESAAVAPVAAVPGSLTAGPVPSAGVVTFFRSGPALKDGKLFIYDASGNMAATVPVSDPSGGAAVRRPVAKWDLQDAKGREAANGTYVARGVITTKAGKTERVSVLINVQR